MRFRAMRAERSGPPRSKMCSRWNGGRQAAILRSPSQSVRNPTTWFQLGVIRDAGPEIANGLGAFLYSVPSKPGFGGSFLLEGMAPD